MKEWILILFVHVGPWGATDSNVILSVPGFKSRTECAEAGAEAGELVAGTKKRLSFVCVEQTK